MKTGARVRDDSTVSSEKDVLASLEEMPSDASTEDILFELWKIRGRLETLEESTEAAAKELRQANATLKAIAGGLDSIRAGALNAVLAAGLVVAVYLLVAVLFP